MMALEDVQKLFMVICCFGHSLTIVSPIMSLSIVPSPPQAYCKVGLFFVILYSQTNLSCSGQEEEDLSISMESEQNSVRAVCCLEISCVLCRIVSGGVNAALGVGSEDCAGCYNHREQDDEGDSNLRLCRKS
jgi:hypothetical protein